MSTGKLSSAAVLRLPAGPLTARPDRSLDEWALLCRVDGERDLAALADGSDHGLAEAVTAAERLLGAGLLELVSDARPGPDGPEPVVDDSEEPEPETAGPEAAQPEAAQPEQPEPEAAQPEAARVEAAQPEDGGGDEGEAAEAEGTRVDPVSLLRELATDTAEAPPDETEAWEELATRLADDPGTMGTAAPGTAGDGQAAAERPDGEAPRQGRGSDQAAFMREFASLATDDEDPPDAPQPPASDPDEERDDRARGGRFGFRKGQRR